MFSRKFCCSSSSLVGVSSTSFPVSLHLLTQTRSFRDNSNSRTSKNRSRKTQLDNIFRSKQKHISEKGRIQAMASQQQQQQESDNQQLQPQRATGTMRHQSSRTRPAVSLLELEEDPELFSPEQQQQQQDSLSVLTGEDALFAAAADQQQEDALFLGDDDESMMKSTPSILIDDTFGYLPEIKADPDVAPGQALVPPGLTRYRVDVQFRGDHFFGWDRQAEMVRNLKQQQKKQGNNDDEVLSSAALARSVRNALEEALVVALDLDELPNKNSREGGGVVPSCILETGVHARRLTCHVDVPSDIVMQPRTVLQRAHIWMNKCSDPLGILSFTPAPPGFHAQHSTRRRVFVYKCLNRIAPPIFDAGTHWHVDRALDINRMNEACKMLQGQQDYTAFADQKIISTLTRFKGSGVRNLERLHVTRQDDEVFIWFVGKSFLRHQIRNMVSVLKMVGQGLWDEEILEQFLKGPTKLADQKPMTTGKHSLGKIPTTSLEVTNIAKWKNLQPPTAPTHGLWLWNSEYNDVPNTEEFEHVDSGSN